MLLTYTGPSMFPTLKPGDCMEVIPYEGSRMRVGDVVVFAAPEREHNVVHRVVSITSEGVRTKGDNNSSVDSGVLSPDDIMGRVVFIRRRDRCITFYGGRRGMITARMLRPKVRVDRIVSGACRPAYHWLARSGIFKVILAPWIKPHVVCFQRRGGTEMQLLMGQRFIGRCYPGRTNWHIQRPFRLFVDESSLPTIQLIGGDG